MRQHGWTSAVVGEHTAALASPVGSVTAPVSEGGYRDARRTLDRAAEAFRGNPTGVLILDGGRELADMWTAQTTRRGTEPTILVDGEQWRCGGGVDTWTTWRRHNAPTIHVAFLRLIDPGRSPLFGAADPPLTIARRLAWYERSMGGPYAMTPGVSAHMAIRRTYRAAGQGKQPYWGVRDTRTWDDPRTGAGDLLWRRRMSEAEARDLPWVHGFDLRAARLSAMGVAELAWSRLEHRTNTPFDPSMAGYWQINAQDVRTSPRLPSLITAGADGMAWPTTPIMRELMDQGRLPAHTDAWIAPGRRFLRDTAERWDAVRREMLPMGGPGEAAVKATYREGAGLFASAGGSIYRPDWYHTIMDRQRVTVMRHVGRVLRELTRRPVAIHTDCVWWASAHPDGGGAAAELGLTLGDRLGNWRHHSVTASQQWRAEQ